MAEKISIHKRNVEARLKSLKDWKTAEENKEDVVEFLHDLELGKVNRGRKVSVGRQLKYLDLLKVPFVFWNKPISELDLKDIEKFEKAISSDQIISYKNKPYSHESKRDIKIALKIYLKWKLGDSKATELAGWLDTRRITKTPDYLKESEIVKLFKSCKSNKERYLLALLFDSGARAEEFLNIRYEDVQLPEKGDSFVKITLKEEYSKTKGRVISSYFKENLINVYNKGAFFCTTCKQCKENCPMNIDLSSMIRDLRKNLVKKGVEPESVKDMIKNIKQFGNPFGDLCGKTPDRLYCC